ncbi:MAG: hypothetical protein AAF479_10980, partial [Pseudomonadota bacterium]
IDADALQTIGQEVGNAIFDGESIDLSLDNLLNRFGSGLQEVLDGSEIAFGSAAADTAVGGALTFTNMFDNTTAAIGDGAMINTGGNGSLDVVANSDIKHYVFAGAGIQASKLGIEGSLVHNRHQTDTIAKIGADTVINAGSLSVNADSNLEKYGFAGGVLVTQRGFGASVATNNVQRNTLAMLSPDFSKAPVS